MAFAVAQYPLTSEQVTDGIDKVIQIEDQSHTEYDIGTKVRNGVELLLGGKIFKSVKEFEDALNQFLVNQTIGPSLRHEKDHGTARTIVQSHLWWYGALALTVLDKAYLSDNSAFLDSDLFRWLIYSYLSSRKSQNINFAEHQHTHCRLTDNDTTNEILDHTMSLNSGHPSGIWKRDHSWHHSNGENPAFGEVSPDDELIPRMHAGDYLKILAKDVEKTYHVYVTTTAYMVKKAVKHFMTHKNLGPETTLKTPQDKIDLAMQSLEEAGFDIGENGESVVIDKDMTINYGKESLKILSQFAGMGATIAINPFNSIFYAWNAILTNCTDYMNHVRTDGKKFVSGMNNLSPELAENVVGFVAHDEHHRLPSGLHQSYLPKIMRNRWRKGEVPESQFEICHVQPGAGKYSVGKTAYHALKDRLFGETKT